MNALDKVTKKAEVSYNDLTIALFTVSFFDSHLQGYQRTHHPTYAKKISLQTKKKSHWFGFFFPLGTHISLFLFFRFLRMGHLQLFFTLFSTLGSKERETVLSVMLAFPLLKD